MNAPEWMLKAAMADRLPVGAKYGDINVGVRGSYRNGTFAEAKPQEGVAFVQSGTNRPVTWAEVVVQEQARLDAFREYLETHPDAHKKRG